jgi:hypothetical protein
VGGVRHPHHTQYEYIGTLLGARPVLHISRIKVKYGIKLDGKNTFSFIYTVVTCFVVIKKKCTRVTEFLYCFRICYCITSKNLIRRRLFQYYLAGSHFILYLYVWLTGNIWRVC